LHPFGFRPVRPGKLLAKPALATSLAKNGPVPCFLILTGVRHFGKNLGLMAGKAAKDLSRSGVAKADSGAITPRRQVGQPRHG
jgi:hypothetical protein